MHVGGNRQVGSAQKQQPSRRVCDDGGLNRFVFDCLPICRVSFSEVLYELACNSSLQDGSLHQGRLRLKRPLPSKASFAPQLALPQTRTAIWHVQYCTVQCNMLFTNPKARDVNLVSTRLCHLKLHRPPPSRFSFP